MIVVGGSACATIDALITHKYNGLHKYQSDSEMRLMKIRKRKASKEELDAAFEKFKSPEMQAKVKEGFDQIERGDYVVITMDELSRRLRID